MNNRTHSTKRVVEGGLITAIIVIMALIDIYMPIFSMVARFIMPIPVVILFLRHDLKTVITSTIISGVIISMIAEPLYGLTAMFMFGITGIALGYCIKFKKSFSFTLIMLSIAFLIATLVDLTVYAKLISNTGIIGVFQDIVKNINESSQQIVSFYKNMGIGEQQLKPLIDSLKLINSDVFFKIMPSIFILAAVAFAYLTYIIIIPILKRLGYNNIANKPKFINMYIDIKVVTIIAIICLVGVILSKRNVQIGIYILYSSQIILQYSFLIQGVAVVTYYLKNRFQMKKGFIILIIIFTGFSVLGNIYFILGFADLIMDFRKLNFNKRIIKK